jgi:hypothetical protein
VPPRRDGVVRRGSGASVMPDVTRSTSSDARFAVISVDTGTLLPRLVAALAI